MNFSDETEQWAQKSLQSTRNTRDPVMASTTTAEFFTKKKKVIPSKLHVVLHIEEPIQT